MTPDFATRVPEVIRSLEDAINALRDFQQQGYPLADCDGVAGVVVATASMLSQLYDDLDQAANADEMAQQG